MIDQHDWALVSVFVTEKICVMTKPSFTERLTQFYVFTRTILEAKIERQNV